MLYWYGIVKNNYAGLVNAYITMSAKRGRCEEDDLADYTICSERKL